MIKNSVVRMIIRNIKIVFFFLALFFTNSCIEEFNATNESFESILVVEASLTDESVYHQVLLSRTFRFDEEGGNPEEGANVKITDNQGSEYPYFEVEPGKYISSSTFSAEKGKDYTLEVRTKNGEYYMSSPERLIGGSPIQDVRGLLDNDFGGNLGVRVVVNTNDPSPDPRFYRYEYEETHKIISPFARAFDAVIISEDPLELDFVFKTKEEETCFITNFSNTTVLGSTVGLSENRLVDQPILFIDKNDYKIRYRYSILVKQHIISREAHAFYSLLKEFSGSESLFTQVQAGFIEGNIVSEQNSEQKAIGFFEVSSVSNQRTFFGFQDFFDGGSLGKYPADCNVFRAPVTDAEIIDIIRNKKMKYVDERILCDPCDATYGTILGNGAYIFGEKECVDCTELGTNIVPDFWED